MTDRISTVWGTECRLSAWDDGTVTWGWDHNILCRTAKWVHDHIYFQMGLYPCGLTPARQAIELRDLLTLADPSEFKTVIKAWRAELASVFMGRTSAVRTQHVWWRVAGKRPRLSGGHKGSTIWDVPRKRRQ